MKVLIADNSEETKTELSRIIVDSGYDYLIVEDSKQVIERIYSEAPDLVILDIKLARPGSLDLLKKLKAAPSTRDIPVMLIASRKSKNKLAKAYGLGLYDYISRPYFREEVLARVRNISEIHEKMKEFEKLLIRDYLTGLYNRRVFMDRFNEEIAWSVMYNEPFSLMMIDIDHFKKINDTYGHACGDEVLRQVAATMLSAMRVQDITARYGGEEFIALLPNTNANSVAYAAEELRSAVQDKEFLCNNSGRIPVTISVGVAVFEGSPGMTLDSIISQADNALYDAKEGGRNRVVVYGQ